MFFMFLAIAQASVVHQFTNTVQTADGKSAGMPIQGALAVTLDLDVLLQVDDVQRREAIVVDLSMDKQVVIYVERLQKRGDVDDFSWFGSNVDEDAQAVLSIKNGILAGAITLGEENYKIVYYATYYLVEKSDPRQLMPFGDDFVPEERPLPLPESLVAKSSSSSAMTLSTAATGTEKRAPAVGVTSTVDVLLLYTQEFKSRYGAAAESNVQNVFDIAVASYSDSLTDVALSLVRMEQLPATSTLNDTSNMSTALSTLAQDGYIRHVRSQYGADTVSLIGTFEDVHSYCGLGRTPTTTSSSMVDAFSVVLYGNRDDGYFCSDLTYAHELGHNFGCFHDHDHASGTPMYTYAYGHDVANEFATIMSYDNPGINYFSHPGITDADSGLPIGIAEGSANPADNARTIRENRDKMADNSSEIDESLEQDDVINTTENGYAIEGYLTARSDLDTYTVNLGGETTFDGNNIGYGAWYFYISLYDEDHQLVYSTDADGAAIVTTTLPNGTYQMMIHKGNWQGDSTHYTMGITSAYQSTAPDNDGDGIPDSNDPWPADPRFSADSDGDGIPDRWEMFQFQGLSAATATSDADGDGYSDLEEFNAFDSAYDPTAAEPTRNEAIRRIPPMLDTLSMNEQMDAGQSYTIGWKALGYDEGYHTTIALFDCTDKAEGQCGNSYSDNFFAQRVDTASQTTDAPWTYSGETAKYFDYSTSFTVPATRADGSAWSASGTKIVVRFYQKTNADSDAGKGSVSLLISGNVTPDYYDATGRRINKTICPSGGCQ